MPEAHHAELLHQFGEGCRVSAQVRVDLIPDVIEELVAALLGPAASCTHSRYGASCPTDRSCARMKRLSLEFFASRRFSKDDGIHAHQHLEDFEVALQVVGGGQQAAQHARFSQDQRLAAFPIAAKGGEGLADPAICSLYASAESFCTGSSFSISAGASRRE